MAKSVGKIKDLIRSLGLEKDANRELLEFIKHHEAVVLQLEQANQRTERFETELLKAKSATQDALNNGKSLENKILRVEKEFAEYRQEVEAPTNRAIATLKRQWEASKRSDDLEPDWKLPDVGRPRQGGRLYAS